jgi:glycosyltransferase involved in cell wall biosynthesis
VCFDERIPTGAGRPFMWIQAIGVLGRDTERAIFGAACPKLCTSRWLARAALGLGNHPDQVHVVPYGLDHTRWRPTSALPDRTRDVALLHHPLLIKGTAAGLATIERARHSMPGLGVTLFGTAPLDTALPDWADFVHAPTPDQLRHQIYGDHRIYLLPAWVEGFGLTGIEAQACGTPLVVTANGGSADYATHGVDALVAQPGDVAGLAEHVLRLLDDTALAVRLADTARLRVRTFDWAASGAILERHLLDHLADPDLGSRDPVTDPSTRDIGPTIRALLSEFYADESSVPDPGQGTSREPSADR